MRLGCGHRYQRQAGGVRCPDATSGCAKTLRSEWPRVRDGPFLDLGEFVGVDFALGPRALNSLDVLKSLVDLIDEFSAQFATDPPCQPTLAWAACREYDGELSRNIEIFGDYLRAAIRHVRDRAVARQRTGPELDLRDPSA